MITSTIANENLKVRISSFGAELQSITDLRTGAELLWQAAPAWPKHAPNLFPVVGECAGGHILVDGRAYPMGRHGFARTSDFTLLAADSGHAVFSLQNSEETATQFPYRFEFQILYDLEGDALRVTYKVINRDDKDIYFSLGAHPAFAIGSPDQADYGDYYLEFEGQAPELIHLLNKQGLFNGETAPAPVKDRKLELTPTLFDHDALVFKHLRSQGVSLRKKNRPEAIHVDFKGFHYLGVWAKPGSSFLCIEPWLGCADSAGPEKELRDKEAIQRLEKGHVFEASFSIKSTN